MSDYRNKLFRSGSRWCSSSELERLSREKDLGPESREQWIRARIRCGDPLFRGAAGRMLGKGMLAAIERAGELDRPVPVQFFNVKRKDQDLMEKVLVPIIQSVASTFGFWEISAQTGWPPWPPKVIPDEFVIEPRGPEFKKYRRDLKNLLLYLEREPLEGWSFEGRWHRRGYISNDRIEAWHHGEKR